MKCFKKFNIRKKWNQLVRRNFTQKMKNFTGNLRGGKQENPKPEALDSTTVIQTDSIHSIATNLTDNQSLTSTSKMEISCPPCYSKCEDGTCLEKSYNFPGEVESLIPGKTYQVPPGVHIIPIDMSQLVEIVPNLTNLNDLIKNPFIQDKEYTKPYVRDIYVKEKSPVCSHQEVNACMCSDFDCIPIKIKKNARKK